MTPSAQTPQPLADEYLQFYQSAKKLLFVEDRVRGIGEILRQIPQLWPMWTWSIVKDRPSALTMLDHLVGTQDFPDVVSVDLGLPPNPDGMTEGLALLQQIREHYHFSMLKLVVHTWQPRIRDEDIHRIIRQQASFIRIADDGSAEAYVMALPIMAIGYLLYSPEIAARIPSILPPGADPLDDDEWVWLRALFEHPGLSMPEVGKKVGRSGVFNFNRELVMKLKRLGFPQFRDVVSPSRESKQPDGLGSVVDITGTGDATSEQIGPHPYYRKLLVAFYEEYHVRYSH